MKSEPLCDGIWKWGLGGWLVHEGGALRNEISALKKGASESSLAASARWRCSKMLAIYELESGLSPELNLLCLDLGLLDLLNSDKQFSVLFKLPSLLNCYNSPEWARTYGDLRKRQKVIETKKQATGCWGWVRRGVDYKGAWRNFCGGMEMFFLSHLWWLLGHGQV